MVQLYSSRDTATVWKNSCFILLEGSDFQLVDNLSVGVCVFSIHISTSFSIDEILLPMYVKWSTNFRSSPFNEIAACWLKHIINSSFVWGIFFFFFFFFFLGSIFIQVLLLVADWKKMHDAVGFFCLFVFSIWLDCCYFCVRIKITNSLYNWATTLSNIKVDLYLSQPSRECIMIYLNTWPHLKSHIVSRKVLIYLLLS